MYVTAKHGLVTRFSISENVDIPFVLTKDMEHRFDGKTIIFSNYAEGSKYNRVISDIQKICYSWIKLSDGKSYMLVPEKIYGCRSTVTQGDTTEISTPRVVSVGMDDDL